MDNGHAEAKELEKEGVLMPMTPGKLISASASSNNNLDEKRGFCKAALYNGFDSAGKIELEKNDHDSENENSSKQSENGEFYGNAGVLDVATPVASSYNGGIKDLFVVLDVPSASAALKDIGGMPGTPSLPPHFLRNAASSSLDNPGNWASVSAASQTTDDLLTSCFPLVSDTQSGICANSQGISPKQNDGSATALYEHDHIQNDVSHGRDASVSISTPQKTNAGRGNGSNMGKRPRQMERKKKLTPKVAKDGYSRKTSKLSTPKPRTPKPSARKPPSLKKSPQERRKRVKKNSIEVSTYRTEEIGQVAKSTSECKRTLDFDCDFQVGDENSGRAKATSEHDPMENLSEANTCSHVLCQPGNNPGDENISIRIAPQYQRLQTAGTNIEKKGSESILEKSESIAEGSLVKSAFIDQDKYEISNKSAPLKVYQRKLRKKQCLKDTVLIPNFPVICKKRRIGRKKGTMWLAIVGNDGVIGTKIGGGKACRQKATISSRRQASLDDPELVFSLLTLLPVLKAKKKRSKNDTQICKLSLGEPRVPWLGNESGLPFCGSELRTLLTRGKPVIPTKRKRSMRFRRLNDIGSCLDNVVSPDAKGEGSSVHQNVPLSQEYLLCIPPCISPPEVVAGPPLTTRKGWEGTCQETLLNIVIQRLQHLCINDDMHNQNHSASIVPKLQGRKPKYLRKDLKRREQKAKYLPRDDSGQLVLYNQPKREGRRRRSLLKDDSGQLMMYNQNHSALVTSKARKSINKPKVVLDSETLRVWNLLMQNGSEAAEVDKEQDIFWEQERKLFRNRVESFTACMHLILGDRRFSPWKGSVLDSVVGVFLTQNVSDHLSSSAYMRLAAWFPPKSVMDATRNRQESVGSNDGRGNQYLVFEPEDDKSCVVVDSRNITITGAAQIISEAEDLGVVKDAVPGHSVSTSSHGSTDCKDEKQTNDSKSQVTSGRKKNQSKKKKNEAIDWDDLRKSYSKARITEIGTDAMDSVDWEGVRCADIKHVAKAIKARGQYNRLGENIQAFLNRILKDHGKIDLEWLRDAPPDKVKDYLLSVYGLGLKSVECVRLLTLHHVAFPVDVNVGRVVVRLGWVPLQPLPDQVLIHLLEKYPLVDDIQKFLWPRLCKLDQRVLYQLHYQLITFGKVFCTKTKPNCNSCPMRGDCKHFASAFASARLALPRPPEDVAASVAPTTINRAQMLTTSMPGSLSEINLSESIHHEPIIEYPPSPELKPVETIVRDIEDCCDPMEDEIPTIRIDSGEFRENLMSFIGVSEIIVQDVNESTTMVPWKPRDASIPVAKLKDEMRLRTEHEVYELPDGHLLLDGFERREPDDPCPYLLAIWMPGKDAGPSKQANTGCKCQESQSHNGNMCFSCSNNQYENFKTVAGTILIPCRTAMRGRFPLNGTYFQVNEVFADYESSVRPINVPRALIWHLTRRRLYCGLSTSSLFKGLTIEQIQSCFWRGFVCVRAFNRTTREPLVLDNKFHMRRTPKNKSEPRKKPEKKVSEPKKKREKK